MPDDTWRRKGYYRTRVLIGTDDVLASPFPDALVCISGPQRNLIQNLMQYLDRRSTFVSEYHANHYLAPSNEEWDDLQEIVADLEEKIMNCDAFTATLEAILAAAQCACKGEVNKELDTLPDYTDPTTPSYYEELVDDGTAIRDAVDETVTIPDVDDACAVSQLVWQWAYEAQTEYVAPIQDVAHTVLLGLVLAEIAVALGATIVGIPVSILVILAGAIAWAWVNGRQANIENAVLSYKFQLICAMYLAFEDGGTFADAAAAAREVVNDMGMPDGDTIVLGRLFSPVVMWIANRAWYNQSAWALANVTPGYCTLCQYGWFTEEYWAEAPPCPGPMTLTGGAYCKDGYWTVAGSNEQLITLPTRRVLAGSYTWRAHYEVKSETPSGWWFGNVRAFRSYDLEEWVLFYTKSVGQTPQGEWTEVWSEPGGLTLTSDAYVYQYFTGQDGQGAYEKFYRGLGWKVVSV